MHKLQLIAISCLQPWNPHTWPCLKSLLHLQHFLHDVHATTWPPQLKMFQCHFQNRCAWNCLRVIQWFHGYFLFHWTWQYPIALPQSQQPILQIYHHYATSHFSCTHVKFECPLFSLLNSNLHAIVVPPAYPIENQEMHLKGATWVKLTADSNGVVPNDGLSAHSSVTPSFLPSCVWWELATSPATPSLVHLNEVHPNLPRLHAIHAPLHRAKHEQ